MATFQTYRVRTLRINKQEQVKLKQDICATFKFQSSDVSIRKVSQGSLKESLVITVKLLKNDRVLQKKFSQFLAECGYFWACDCRENSLLSDNSWKLYNAGISVDVRKLVITKL